jgi:hypothetical protein
VNRQISKDMLHSICSSWADNGQTFPYPWLAVRARNGRVADHPGVK